MLSKHNFNHQTIFYPRTVFNKFNFDTNYKLLADYILNIKLYFGKDFDFKYVDCVICRFNDWGSSGQYQDIAFKREERKIITSNFPLNVIAFYNARKAFIYLKSIFTSNGIKKI